MFCNISEEKVGYRYSDIPQKYHGAKSIMYVPFSFTPLSDTMRNGLSYTALESVYSHDLRIYEYDTGAGCNEYAVDGFYDFVFFDCTIWELNTVLETIYNEDHEPKPHSCCDDGYR